MKPWACQANLITVNLQCMAFKDDDELVWFFQQLQTLDRLTLLVLAMQHIRQARSIISESGQEVSQFFCFHLVTSLEVWKDVYKGWCGTVPMTRDELALVVESAPSLRWLSLQLRVDKHFSENLKVNYSWLTIKR